MPKMLFAGGRLDSLAVLTGTPVEITTAGQFDSTYADNAVSLTGTNAGVVLATFRDSSDAPVDVVTGETAYLHYEAIYAVLNNTSVTVGTITASLVDASNQPWLAIRVATTTGFLGLYYNSGTGASPVWTLIDTTFPISNAVRNIFDIKLTLGSPHSVELSQGGSLLRSGTFTQAALTALRGARFAAANNNGTGSSYSQIMATEGISTINGKVRYSRPTAAGANSAWTGAFTDVNEAINSDATLNAAATAGLSQTYAMGDVTVPVGLVIKSVFHFMRGKNDGASPLNIKSVIRSGGTNYPAAANVPGIGTSFGPLPTRWDTDPATGTSWTEAGWNAAEAGYDSVA